MRTAAREADSWNTLSPESEMWVATAARHASHYYLKAGPHMVCTRDSRFLEHVPRNIAILPEPREQLSSLLSKLIAIIIINAIEMCIYISNTIHLQFFVRLKIRYENFSHSYYLIFTKYSYRQ